MSADPIMAALEEQVSCYQRLAKLAEVQHEHVQQSETEALLEILSQRQRVLDQIGALERTLSPARAQWGAYLGRLEPAQRGLAEAMLAETRMLLERITAADRNDALVLQQRKLSLGREINQAAAGRQVNRNYAAAAYAARQSTMDLQR